MGFPTKVNVQPAVAVAGDFASQNPRSTVIAALGQAAFIAAAAGVTVGAFAWADPTFTTLSSNNVGALNPTQVTGFIGREGFRADIVTPGPNYPDNSNTILGGSFLTCYNGGDFFVTNNGSTTSAIGNTCYANYSNGLATFAAANSPPAAATVSSMTVTANTLNVSSVAVNAFTAAIAAPVGTALSVMNVSAITTGGLFPGMVITGTNVEPGTTVVAQLTGTAGSTGTYSVSIDQTVASEAMTGSGGWLTVTSMTNGVIYVGQTLSGGSNAFAAGTTVLAGGTGTGTNGTYPVSIAQTLASTATATGSGGYLTATTVTAGGVLGVGDLLSSTSGTATILPYGTGGTTGIGAGGGTTYVLSNASEAGDTSGHVYSGVATKWVAQSVGAPGELVAISTVALG